MNDDVRSEVVALARILTDPEVTKAAIVARVVALAGDDLPKVVIRAREVQSLAKHVITTGEAELELRAIAARSTATTATDGEQARAAPVAIGGRWVDKGTGVVHRFEGELSDWKVADPRGLRHALATITRPDGSRMIADTDIDRAVVATYKPDHRILNELAKIDLAVDTVIADFRKKDRGPAHLKEDTD